MCVCVLRGLCVCVCVSRGKRKVSWMKPLSKSEMTFYNHLSPCVCVCFCWFSVYSTLYSAYYKRLQVICGRMKAVLDTHRTPSVCVRECVRVCVCVYVHVRVCLCEQGVCKYFF